MIEASAGTQELAQRLRERAAKLAAAMFAEGRSKRKPGRHHWHSAEALWPDIFGENRDGK